LSACDSVAAPFLLVLLFFFFSRHSSEHPLFDSYYFYELEKETTATATATATAGCHCHCRCVWQWLWLGGCGWVAVAGGSRWQLGNVGDDQQALCQLVPVREKKSEFYIRKSRKCGKKKCQKCVKKCGKKMCQNRF
jgi:hypothetical protein